LEVDVTEVEFSPAFDVGFRGFGTCGDVFEAHQVELTFTFGVDSQSGIGEAQAKCRRHEYAIAQGDSPRKIRSPSIFWGLRRCELGAQLPIESTTQFVKQSNDEGLEHGCVVLFCAKAQEYLLLGI